MIGEEELLYKRFLELGRKSQSCHYYIFTDFLGLMERSVFEEAKRELGPVPCTAFGGTHGCERVMIRFGDPSELGYEEPFPIKILEITPLSPKFAEKLSHRDYLGSILALGIERCKIGDIVILEDSAYLFASDDIADYVKESLSRIRRTDVRCEYCEELPEGELFKTKRVKIQASGERVDAVVAKVFSLSREEASRLFVKRCIFIDGKLCENQSKVPKVGSTVSVRGYGRFIYLGYETLTKKGKKNIEVDLFV